jgi:hypothetical protein
MEVNTWIEDWVSLWPEDVRWNNERIRSSKAECLGKMEKWVKANPKYNREQIFKATEAYLINQEFNNWQYTMKAHYFIDKKGKGSTLLEYCTAQDGPQEEINKNFFNNFI